MTTALGMEERMDSIIRRRLSMGLVLGMGLENWFNGVGRWDDCEQVIWLQMELPMSHELDMHVFSLECLCICPMSLSGVSVFAVPD